MNKSILLNHRPVGSATLSNFKFRKEAIPVPHEGQILLKTLYVSVDPNIRGRMNNVNSYIPAFGIKQTDSIHVNRQGY